ncbi:unknown similar to AMEV260 [Adoxophyes honmai entomopoxvirus 'L']|uniref:Reverse transcriptase domain-containing protein n=1 Tax=Adoxophyes honmai entomopoxvirus 'L' TaxID=1293540 RepID=A0A916NWW6_9POXV|nr:unknown similar to AMEV260 [Adoxophyes honmai entomopoxvirus 'L']CCU55438.1 unknown similar to AMEV260 [Adoxophyes honmai entomopoxvirus 'L']
MNLNLDKYYNNNLICSSCKYNINRRICHFCPNFLCSYCSFNNQIYYNLNIIEFSKFIYKDICIKCIINQFLQTNIFEYDINKIINVFKLSEKISCEHMTNLHELLTKKISLNLYDIMYNIDETKNTSIDSNIFKYENFIIFNKKCFVCLFNYIRNNYFIYKHIFTTMIIIVCINCKVDYFSIDMPKNLLKISYVINKHVIPILSTDTYDIKIIAVLRNDNRYDRYYDFNKNLFNHKIKHFYSKIISDPNQKKNLRDYKYYLYCDVKTDFQKNLLNNLKNIDNYNVNQELFNKLYTINSRHEVTKLVSNDLKNKYKYIITLDLKNAFASISHEYLTMVINKYINKQSIINNIIEHVNYLNTILKEDNQLHLNEITPYLFKLCMYDIVESIELDVNFYNICDDFILFDNDINKLIIYMTRFNVYISNHGMTINKYKFRIYEYGKQNIYFLNTVVCPSNSLRKIINRWLHIIYKPDSNIFNKLNEKYKNMQYIIEN